MDLEPLVREMIRIPDKPAEGELKDTKTDQNKGSDKPEGSTNNISLAPRPTGLSTGGLFSKSKSKLNPTTASKETKKSWYILLIINSWNATNLTKWFASIVREVLAENSSLYQHRLH